MCVSSQHALALGIWWICLRVLGFVMVHVEGSKKKSMNILLKTFSSFELRLDNSQAQVHVPGVELCCLSIRCAQFTCFINNFHS